MCEIAWVAGFFEGDGIVYVRRAKPGRRRAAVYLSIGQTDLERLERVQQALKCGSIRGPYSPARNKLATRQQWFWTVSKGADVRRSIDEMWPYLGETTRQRIIEVYGRVVV